MIRDESKFDSLSTECEGHLPRFTSSAAQRPSRYTSRSRIAAVSHSIDPRRMGADLSITRSRCSNNKMRRNCSPFAYPKPKSIQITLLFRRFASFQFSFRFICREIEACSHLLASLCSCLEQLMVIRAASEPGSLFPSGTFTAQELFNMSANVNQYSFYGRCLGFHVRHVSHSNFRLSPHSFAYLNGLMSSFVLLSTASRCKRC